MGRERHSKFELLELAFEYGMTIGEARQAIINYSKFLKRENKGGRPSKIELWFASIKQEEDIEDRISLLCIAKESMTSHTWYYLRKKIVEENVLPIEKAFTIVYP